MDAHLGHTLLVLVRDSHSGLRRRATDFLLWEMIADGFLAASNQHWRNRCAVCALRVRRERATQVLGRSVRPECVPECQLAVPAEVLVAWAGLLADAVGGPARPILSSGLLHPWPSMLALSEEQSGIATPPPPSPHSDQLGPGNRPKLFCLEWCAPRAFVPLSLCKAPSPASSTGHSRLHGVRVPRAPPSARLRTRECTQMRPCSL